MGNLKELVSIGDGKYSCLTLKGSHSDTLANVFIKWEFIESDTNKLIWIFLSIIGVGLLVLVFIYYLKSGAI